MQGILYQGQAGPTVAYILPTIRTWCDLGDKRESSAQYSIPIECGGYLYLPEF